MDSNQARLRGRIGAYVKLSRHDPAEDLRKARAAFLGRFLVEVDPEGVLPEAERERRAEAARKAHYLRMALKSAEARAKKRRARPAP